MDKTVTDVAAAVADIPDDHIQTLVANLGGGLLAAALALYLFRPAQKKDAEQRPGARIAG